MITAPRVCGPVAIYVLYRMNLSQTKLHDRHTARTKFTSGIPAPLPAAIAALTALAACGQ